MRMRFRMHMRRRLQVQAQWFKIRTVYVETDCCVDYFALGFAAAKLCGPDCGFRGPRVEFANGCLDVASVKCPRVQDALPAMDIDQDGCITRAEYDAVKTELRRHIRAEMRD